jgi:hypothetical protein
MNARCSTVTFVITGSSLDETVYLYKKSLTTYGEEISEDLLALGRISTYVLLGSVLL